MEETKDIKTEMKSDKKVKTAKAIMLAEWLPNACPWLELRKNYIHGH